MQKKFYSLLCLWVCMFVASQAQYYSIEMAQKVAHANTVVEGRVIAQQSFWNPQRSIIFTANTVEVYKIFKGKQVPATLEIQTVGGSVGDDYMEASHLLSLSVGETGVFFCQEAQNNLRHPKNGLPLLDVYSSEQGFLRYDLSQNKATCPFVEVTQIEDKLYPLLQAALGQPLITVNPNFRAVPPPPVMVQHAANITGFSPASVWAGAHNDPARNTLTINGSGFGVPEGSKAVVFRDGNSSSNANPSFAVLHSSPLIQSWTDNQIRLLVPSRAGTGNFCVVLSPGDTAFAPAPLTVSTSILTASFSSGAAIIQSMLMDRNGQGGYSIVYSTNTAGSAIDITTDAGYDAFRRALNTWKNTAGVPVVEAGTTTQQTVSGGDGINIIMYDNANTGVARQDGTIAVTYSSYSRCGGSPHARKMGFDIVFNNPNYSVALSQPYNKTVCNPVINTYDFEATALHELGHAFNLGHVISPQEQSSNYTNRNPGGVIHPTATLSVARKSLDHHVLDGILYTTTQFGYTDYGACNTDPEVAPLTRNIPANDNCPATFPNSATPEGQSYTIDLVNATSNKLVDPQFRAIGTAGNANGTGVTVTNNVYQAIRTAQGGTLSITISNYSPEADAEACPTTGARVALYQVNSCPAGQNWPAPAYAATFTGNTTLNFNGLPANTNYILFFEGVANTKSTFTATLGNSALPIRIINFSGAIQGKHHLLTLSMGLLQDVSRLELERSADGQQFNRLASFNARGPLEQKLTDASPLPGKNYYRVLVVHANGQVEYSKTIVLQRPDADGFKLLSNPVSNQLQLLLPTGGAHAYTIHLNDMQGRLLLTHTNAGGLVTLPTATLAAGVYQLRVMNKEGKTVFMERVVK